VLRVVRTIVDKPQLDAFGSLLPEDQFEVLQYLAEGFSVEEVYRNVVVERRPADATPEVSESLDIAITNTAGRITLVTEPDELAAILDKPFAAWRVFLHPSQRRVAHRVPFNGDEGHHPGPATAAMAPTSPDREWTAAATTSRRYWTCGSPWWPTRRRRRPRWWAVSTPRRRGCERRWLNAQSCRRRSTTSSPATAQDHRRHSG
jgi:hypothetical protein